MTHSAYLYKAQFDWRIVTGFCCGILLINTVIPPELKQEIQATVEISVEKVTGQTEAKAKSISSNKSQAALTLILNNEGGCQNERNDSGNWFQGQLGYTCMGITPSEGWQHRGGLLKDLEAGFNGNPAMFVKFAHDQNPAVFKKAAEQIYATDYFAPGGCADLSQPAFEVCADIAVNSGIGKSRQYLKEMRSNLAPKSLATTLNERHRQDYIRWSASGKNTKFRVGWLNRAEKRSLYIDKF